MLPQGLEDGEVVRLLEFDHGYYVVECADGRRFHIASNCVEPVPPEFFSNHRAGTLLKRMRSLFLSGSGHSGLLISTRFRYLRFCVFGDDHKMRGALEIHKDAILNLGSEFREKIGRLLALRSQSYTDLETCHFSRFCLQIPVNWQPGFRKKMAHAVLPLGVATSINSR